MQLPAFFREARRLRVRDPLAEFLGAAPDGILEYGYEDAVKLAGHSCPTVASAYLLTCRALDALYPGELPERGGVTVSLRDSVEAGVSGVIASIATLLTGAAGDGGFRGLGGRFGRRDLLAFGTTQSMALRFTRVDTGAAVDAQADLGDIPGDPEMPELMGRCLHGEATAAERARFGALWQERVRRILIEHADDQSVFVIRPAA